MAPPNFKNSPSVDFNIVKKLSGFTTVRDDRTKTQYAYSSAGLVSYDDERAICDKTEYAMEHALNGYIIWEISGDLLPDLSTPLLDAANDRLNRPGVTCDSKHGSSAAAAFETAGEFSGAGAVVAAKAEAASWYPDRTIGFCVNDGKHVEKFIVPD